MLWSAPWARASAAFAPHTIYPVGDGPWSVTVGDVDGDADPDLAVANFGDLHTAFSNTVSVLLGGAGGSFGPQTAFLVGDGPQSVAVGDFNDDAVTSPQRVPLSGTGTPGPWLTRSLEGLKFGHVPVGKTTATKQVTLTNTGSAPLTITSIVKEGANPSDFRNLTQTCTVIGTLNPGQSCTASIAFRPAATGPRTASLTITNNTPRNPRRVVLSGTGT